MREVCLLNDSFPPIIDGVANTVVNYANVMYEQGREVSVVTPEYPGADDSGFPYPVIRYPSIDVRDLVGYMAGNPFYIPTVHQVRKRNIDLLHCHCPIASCVFARELKELLDVPMILTYHTKYDVDIANVVRSGLVKDMAVRLLVHNLSGCDELWVVSRGAGESIRSLGYQGDYVVMENGVDVARGRASDDEVREATKDYDLPEDIPVFLFVGRLMWYKGLHIILDALAMLKSRGMDFRMVLIGGGGDEKAVRECTQETGLADRVFFTGPICERRTLIAWYTRADLFLFPSTFDTNGLVVREAAACSLGSVLIAGSCAAEGVTDGTDGLLIEENAEAMAACLTGIMKDRAAMRCIGENASDNLYFSWEDAVKKAEERYETVLDNYRSGKHINLRATSVAMSNAIRGDIGKFTADFQKLINDMTEYHPLGWKGEQDRNE